MGEMQLFSSKSSSQLSQPTQGSQQPIQESPELPPLISSVYPDLIREEYELYYVPTFSVVCPSKGLKTFPARSRDYAQGYLDCLTEINCYFHSESLRKRSAHIFWQNFLNRWQAEQEKSFWELDPNLKVPSKEIAERLSYKLRDYIPEFDISQCHRLLQLFLPNVSDDEMKRQLTELGYRIQRWIGYGCFRPLAFDLSDS